MQGAQVREQMVALEDKPEVIPAQFRQLFIAQRAGLDAVDLVAAGGGVVQAAEDIHQGGFARTRGTDDRDHFAGMNRQVDALECDELALAGHETAGNALELQQGLGHGSVPRHSWAGVADHDFVALGQALQDLHLDVVIDAGFHIPRQRLALGVQHP